MIIHVRNIVWETDGQKVDLPSEGWLTGIHSNGHILTEDEKEDIINLLSDRYGFLISTATITYHDSD